MFVVFLPRASPSPARIRRPSWSSALSGVPLTMSTLAHISALPGRADRRPRATRSRKTRLRSASAFTAYVSRSPKRPFAVLPDRILHVKLSPILIRIGTFWTGIERVPKSRPDQLAIVFSRTVVTAVTVLRRRSKRQIVTAKWLLVFAKLHCCFFFLLQIGTMYYR